MKEYIVFGRRVRLSASQVDMDYDPEKAVDLVTKEAEKIKQTAPSLDDTNIFLLTALKIAGEKINLKEGLTKDIEDLESSAREALAIATGESNQSLS